VLEETKLTMKGYITDFLKLWSTLTALTSMLVTASYVFVKPGTWYFSVVTYLYRYHSNIRDHSVCDLHAGHVDRLWS